MIKLIYFVLLSGLVILPGCKTDNEQDYLDYLASQHQPNPDTPDAPDTPDVSTSGVFLNELDGNSKSIEFYNTGNTDTDISGYTLIKDDEKTIYIAPEGTVIPSKGFYVISGNASDYGQGFTSGLSADKATKIELLDSDGESIDMFCNLPSDPGGTWQDSGTYSGKSGKRSFSRFPDGTGNWYVSDATLSYPNKKGDLQIMW